MYDVVMTQADLTGALTCARYAFAPNLYHYCGPDTHGDLQGYLKEEMSDPGLVEHLTKFETLYPYLQSIAHANGLADPLDPRVVESYWVGHPFLEKVTPQQVYLALTEAQKLPKRLPQKEFDSLLPKIGQHPRLHHSFHVFNVFTQTGHATLKHTVETMNECRIGWGQIINIFKLTLSTQKLIYKDSELKFIPTTREVIVPSESLLKSLKVGDWVSFHWGFVCDKLSLIQVKRLEKYTLYHLKLANETL
jgi:hypothetical protein